MRWMWLLLLVGCSEAPPPKKKVDPRSMVPEIPAAPAKEVPKAAPKQVKVATVAERKARYEGRKTVQLPSTTPKAWRDAIEGLGGKLTDASFETWQAPVRLRGASFEMRVWGTDADAQRRVLAALKAAGVAQVGATVPLAKVTVDDAEWRLSIDHLKAPAGDPREHLVAFRWSRTPKPKWDRPECTTPEPIDAPPELPSWLKKATRKQFLRRRVGLVVGHHLDGPTVDVYMYHRNGYAMDDLVGIMSTHLKGAGFHHDSGEGPRQRWTQPDGARVSWTTTRVDPVIGCTPEGPVLIISWKGPTP